MHTPIDSMIYSPSTNLVDVVVDEIALEGLDGITLEALWQRLSMRLSIPLPLSVPLQEQIWNICISIRDLIFYELPEARKPLILFDRYEFVDPDLGTILEPSNCPEDIYEHCPINDTENGIKGSCMNYETRKLIQDIRNLSLKEACEKFDKKLIIVGSQSCRQNALMGDSISPTLELNVMQYCFLERVGRARYHGEVTQGKRSLSMMKEDPKSLFYHRKFLTKQKLITKQTHHQKISGHATAGSLLHLPRFFVERKPKMIFLAERIIEILKSRDNCLVDYVEIKKELELEGSIKTLFKTNLFQRVVRTDLSVPYRALYPNAQKSEWQRKGIALEKKIRGVQLIDPNIDINDLWNKDEPYEEEEFYELDISSQKINEPLLKQANAIVESTRYDGMSQTELSKRMGLSKLQARTIFRNLSKLGIVASYMNDVGRQRITKFVSKKFEKNSNISKQFQTEMDKMKEHTRISNIENAVRPILTTKEFLDPVEQERIKSDKINESEIIDDPMEIDIEPETVVSTNVNRKNLFSHANRVVKKYKLTKWKSKYQVTYHDVSKIKDLKKKIEKLVTKINKSSKKNLKKPVTEDTADVCVVNLEEVEVLNNSKGELRSLIKDLNPNDPKITGTVTYRILKRANLIIASVKEHKVIDDTTKLMKLINEEEDREGYESKIDRKSLVRLLRKLEADNLVKNIKLTLSAKGRKKCLTFICDPSINVNHSVIQSAVEQARIKFSIIKTSKVKAQAHKRPTNTNEKQNKKIVKLKDDTDFQLIPTNIIFDPKAGKSYGYSSKFDRMKIIHLLLYHIIYDHPGPSKISRAKQLEKLGENYEIDDFLANEMSEIYSTQVCWKMFIPPLITHIGWPVGWAMMCDILLRIPLSIFLKIYNNPYRIPDLDYYINHPIRQHYLIKDLPTPLRNVLLIKRKYIFSIHESITRLCYIGLIQFGPQKLKEKDQVFVYLNRKSELMDTTSSAAHYHKIEDKSYPVFKYDFDTIQTVEKYWYEMWHICVNTLLGGRLVVQGTEIILEDLAKKQEMIETLKPRTAKEAADMDLGIMPGDKKGSAGIDSAFFAHLKRNWNWGNIHGNKQSTTDFDSRVNECERNAKLSNIEAKPIIYTEFTGLKTNSGPTHVDANQLKVVSKNNKKSPEKKKLDVESVDKILREELLSNKSKRQNTIIRKVMPRKKKARTRVKYDDIDYSALQKMDKLRVDWEPREDNILLVCKVVMMYLCPNPRSQVITFTAVRDVLRSYSGTSYNKTSRACQRRLLYMLKKPQTIHSVALGVEEMKQNYYVHKRYGDIVNKIRKSNNSTDLELKVSEIFKNLVTYVAQKYYDISQNQSKERNHKLNTVQEFNLVYETSQPNKPKSSQGFKNDVKSVNDIHTATINSVIYSSMCSGKDRRSWAYQLFKIYQQYPELLLRNAMGKIRSDQMVSMKKNYLNAIKKYGNCMPMSSSQYQLSTSYVYKFQTKLPAECYTEMFDFFIKILNGYENNLLGEAKGIEVLPPSGGMIVGIQEFLENDKIDFNIEIPEHIITLDPKLAEYDETYVRISKRYQDILASLEQLNVERTSSNVDKVIQQDETKKIDENTEIEKVVADVKELPITKIDRESISSSNLNLNKQNLRKSTQPKTHWTIAQVTMNLIGEDIENQINPSNEDGRIFENNVIEDDDDNDFIRFQDGTIISISKDDIEKEKYHSIDDKIHEAFLKTRINKIDDFPSCSVIDQLKMISNEETLMETEENNQQNLQINSPILDNQQEIIENENINNHVLKNSNYINDIIENTICDMGTKFNSTQKDEDTNDPTKKYTRIALLKMREELNEDLPDSHHAHEYFVVSTFGIFYSLPQLDEEIRQNSDLIIDNNKKSKVLMLDEKIYKNILSDIKKFAIFPKEFSEYETVIKNLASEENIKDENLNLIFKYVQEKREQGATLKELSNLFYKILGNQLYKLLLYLTERRLFLRSGVTEGRYVHYKFVDPWLVQSIRIKRLQRESLPPIPPSTVYVFNKEEDNLKKSEELNSKDNINENIGEGGNAGNQKTMRIKRTCLLQTKDIHSAAKKLDLNTAEDINVVIRPWIQIDGLINRSVLEQMLGAVLAHCVMHPGIFLLKVQERFVPALQPYHTRELVEILIKLGCLKLKILQKGPSTLFSESSFIRLNYPLRQDGTSEYDEEIIIEPTVNSTIRFVTFIRQNHDQIQT